MALCIAFLAASNAIAETREEVRSSLVRYVGEWNVLLIKREANGSETWLRGTARFTLVGDGWLTNRIRADGPTAQYQSEEVLGYNFVDGRWAAVRVDSESAYVVRSTGTRHQDSQMVFVGPRHDGGSGAWVTVARTDSWTNEREFITDFVAMPTAGVEYSLLKIHYTLVSKPVH